jgi:hypothetical protein
MPMTMDIWYSATNRPLIVGGENSEIYNGANTEAIPIPSPPNKRAGINKLNDGGIAEPRAEKKNKIPISQYPSHH